MNYKEQLVNNINEELKYKRLVDIGDMIQICQLYTSNVKKEPYPKTNLTKKYLALKLALEFYKQNEDEYYRILNGIESKVISFGYSDSFVKPDGKKCLISPFNCDVTCYIIVHELAHFLDCTSANPVYSIYAEVCSYLKELYFDEFLNSIGYAELVKIRENNRIFNVTKKSKAILQKIDLMYDNQSNLNLLNNKKIRNILNYSRLIDSSIRYPIEYNHC